MKGFDITLLGVSSALPVKGRYPSCQIINYDERLIMIDCGEGAQLRLTDLGIRRMKIDAILISHLHGDHCYGLPGVITSFALYNRTAPLHLHGPIGIKRFIEGVLTSSGAHLSFDLIIHEHDFEKSEVFYFGEHLRISTIPLNHRVPTIGYRLQEHNLPRKIDPAKIEQYTLTVDEIIRCKSGQDVVRGDTVIPSEACLLPPSKERSYAYCSDTIYDPSIVTHIQDVQVLYHETTYLSDLEHLAKERLHTTLEQAIDIAHQADADVFVSGHYSSRYNNLSEFEERGKKLFKNFVLGVEGLKIPVS